jgi:Zn-dependent protease with chaperone function
VRFLPLGYELELLKLYLFLTCGYLIYYHHSPGQIVKILIFYGISLAIINATYLIVIKLYGQFLIEHFKRITGFKEKISLIPLPLPDFVATAGITEKGKRVIVLSTGTVKKVSREELDFIVAHEFAHHYKNHLANIRLIRGARTTFALLSIFTLSTFTPAGLLVGALSGLIGSLFQWHIKRKELEADLTAVELLKKANLSCRGGEKFFKRILKEGIYGELLDEHPRTEKRLNEVKRKCSES